MLVFLAACGTDLAEPADQKPEPQLTKEEVAARGDTKDDLAEDFCKINGWDDDGVCDWFCLGGDPDCNADLLGPDPVGVGTEHPIVLVHGFMASRTSGGGGMLKIVDVLLADGHDPFYSETPPFSTTEERALAVEKYIVGLLKATGATKVNLIAHSMGGLDSRYLISKNGLNRSDIVASLTTLGTPHRGTRLADVADGVLPEGIGWSFVLDSLIELYGESFSKKADKNTNFRGALSSLSEKNAPEFNATHRNVDGVIYQSYAGIASITGIANLIAPFTCDGKVLSNEGTYAKVSKLFWPIVPIIAEVGAAQTEPNDGLILVDSAKWGDFKGCLPADHLDLSGDGSDKPNENTGFYAPRLFRQIAFDLADQGL